MLEFEKAGVLRDQIIELRKVMEGDPVQEMTRVVELDGARGEGREARGDGREAKGDGRKRPRTTVVLSSSSSLRVLCALCAPALNPRRPSPLASRPSPLARRQSAGTALGAPTGVTQWR